MSTQLQNTMSPYLRGVLPTLYTTPHSQIYQYNRIEPPPYNTPLPNIQYSVTDKPRYELVVFNDCFAKDRCNVWTHSKQMKKNWRGHGCAINSLRFLNLIKESQQTDFIAQLTSDGTPFEDIIEFIKEFTNTQHIVEKQYSVNSLQNVTHLFTQLDHWMPTNSCVIFRANYIGHELGHTAIIAKDNNNKLYIIDPLFNRIILHNSQKFFDNNKYTVNTISLMFKINISQRTRTTGGMRTYRRRHSTHKRRHHTHKFCK